MKKAFKFLVVGLAVITAMLTFTHVSLGSGLDGIADFLRENAEGVYVANSPIIAMTNYAGQNQRKLFSTLVNDMEVWGDITPHTMLKSKLNMTKLSIADGARPYAGGLEDTSQDALNYTGLVLEAELGQRDFAIEIKKYYNQWLEMELNAREGSAATAKTIPFAQYTYNEIFKALRSELNNKTAYFGFKKSDAVAYAAGDTYAVNAYITFVEGALTNYYQCTVITTAGQSPTTHPAKWRKVNAEAICPGFRHHLAGLISSSAVTPVTIGVIDNADVFAYAAHSALFRSHKETYQKMGVVHYCSYEQFYLLMDDIEDKVAKYTEKDANYVGKRGLILPKTNGKCEIRPCTWMSGSERIMSTPQENLHGCTDLLSDLNSIATREATNYVAVSSIAFTLGFQIQDPAAFRTNDRP